MRGAHNLAIRAPMSPPPSRASPGRPRRPAQEGTPGFRIREAREESRLTQQQLGELLGVQSSAISKIETGRENASRSMLLRIAAAVGKSPGWLDYGETARMLQVQGKVGAYARVEAIPFDTGRWIEIPGDWADAYALEVAGDSCFPIYADGDVLVIRGERRLHTQETLGKMCVVETSDGLSLVKRVYRGVERGLYNLESPNAPLMQDIPLVSARPVRWVWHP